MKKTTIAVFCFIVFLLIAGLVLANTVSLKSDWTTTGTVTSTHINSNFSSTQSAINANDTAFKNNTASHNNRILGNRTGVNNNRTIFRGYTGTTNTRVNLKANAASPALTGTGTFVNMSGTGNLKLLNGKLYIKDINNVWRQIKVTGAGFGKISTI